MSCLAASPSTPNCPLTSIGDSYGGTLGPSHDPHLAHGDVEGLGCLIHHLQLAKLIQSVLAIPN
jgi:hypothetical protein